MYVTVARVLIYRKLRVACVPASWASLLRSVWYAVGVWRYASGERLTSVQSGSYQCKRICKRILIWLWIWETSLYIYGPSGLERSVNQQVFLASKVTLRVTDVHDVTGLIHRPVTGADASCISRVFLLFSFLCTIEYTHTVLPNFHIATLRVAYVLGSWVSASLKS
jgi:hypothetical protein